MSAFQSLAPRPPANLETVHNILGSLVARYRQEEVLTAVWQIPARDAKFLPMPAWVASALVEAYQEKGIRVLAPGSDRRTVAGRQECRCRDADCVGQDTLLQPAGLKCSFGECRYSCSVFVSNQSAGSGSIG